MRLRAWNLRLPQRDCCTSSWRAGPGVAAAPADLNFRCASILMPALHVLDSWRPGLELNAWEHTSSTWEFCELNSLNPRREEHTRESKASWCT